MHSSSPLPRGRSRGRHAFLLQLAACLVVVASFAGSSSDPADAGAVVERIDITRPGPLGAVTVIGDSVLVGAALTSPTLPDQLAARGWGPIRMRAAGSASSGLFNVSNEYRSSFWIDLWQGAGWDPRHVIVNLGVNDSGLCRASVSCAYDSIMHMVDAIGPGHEIWWPTIVKTNAAQHISFNTALRRVEAERADFHVWDWYSEYVNGGYRSGDEVHLDPAGYRRRSEVMAAAFTDDLGRSRRAGGDALLPSPTAPASTFVAMPPQRVADTRTDSAERLVGGTRHTIDFGALLPDDATAVALYVTAARPAARGYLSTGPCDAEPSGATVNFGAGTPRGAPTITAIGETGTVCVFSSVDTDLVVDLQGTFVADGSGARMTPLATPRRLHDTRETGRLDTVVVEVGSGLDAVAVNLGAARAGAVGYLSASSCAEPRLAANVNFAPGAAVSSSAIVPVDDDGTFCVFASEAVDVIIDLTAEFARDGALAYLPVTPTRTLDTRLGIGGWLAPLAPGQTIDVGAAPPTAAAVTGTLAIIRPSATGFLTADGCAGPAGTASVNAAIGTIMANSLTSAITDGRLCITSSARAHAVFDTNGWWVAAGA